MLLIIDWLDGNTSGEAGREALLDLDWRSPDEFMGYLALVLTGLVDEEAALKAWDTASEKSWLLYTVGLIREKGTEWAASETLLRKAVLAADPEAWPFFLAKAGLDAIRRKRLGTFNDKDRWTAYQADVNAFDESLLKDQAAKAEGRARVAALKTRLEMEAANARARQEILALIHEADPDDRDVLVGLAFYSAMDEDWSKALEYAKAYLKRGGRQNAARLSLGLLEAEILYRLGRSEEAQTSLEAYVRRTRDPWYRAVSEVLQGKRSEDSLKQEGGKTPENLLVLQTALGFWSEGSGNNEKAMKHYKVAMESFMTTRVEFDFARERLKKLRKASK